MRVFAQAKSFFKKVLFFCYIVFYAVSYTHLTLPTKLEV